MGSQITNSDIIDEFPIICGSIGEPKANVPRTVIAQGALHSWAWDYPTEEAREGPIPPFGRGKLIDTWR